MEDAVAVLDAVGSTSAALFGVGIGGLVAMLLSASHPQRLSAQVLVHAYARAAQGADYAFGYPQEVIDDWIDTVTDPSHQGDPIDDLALTAPSLVHDLEFRSWWRRAGERSSPAIAHATDVLTMRADVRAVLPLIGTPTLLLHRVDCEFLPIGHAALSRRAHRGVAPRRVVRRGLRRVCGRHHRAARRGRRVSHRGPRRAGRRSGARDDSVHRHRGLDETSGRLRRPTLARAARQSRPDDATTGAALRGPAREDHRRRRARRRSTVRRGRFNPGSRSVMAPASWASKYGSVSTPAKSSGAATTSRESACTSRHGFKPARAQ